MSESRKYYYMKMKDSFFDSEEMKILESQKNGCEYQNLYLKMCLLSLKAEGKLIFKNAMPYDCGMLSTVLRMNIDTVKTGIEMFQKLGLVEIVGTETIFMSDIQTLIGSSSTEADRIKSYRKRIKTEGKRTQKSVQMYKSCTPEIELEIDIKKEKDSVICLSSPLPKESKKTYGEFENVTLTDKEYAKLIHEYGHDQTNGIIEKLSIAKAEKGYKYKSDMAAIRKWVVKATGAVVVERPKICPYCGGEIGMSGICRNKDCPQYEGGTDEGFVAVREALARMRPTGQPVT